MPVTSSAAAPRTQWQEGAARGLRTREPRLPGPGRLPGPLRQRLSSLGRVDPLRLLDRRDAAAGPGAARGRSHDARILRAPSDSWSASAPSRSAWPASSTTWRASSSRSGPFAASCTRRRSPPRSPTPVSASCCWLTSWCRARPTSGTGGWCSSPSAASSASSSWRFATTRRTGSSTPANGGRWPRARWRAGFLSVALVDRRGAFLIICFGVLALQAGVGLLGFYFHVAADVNGLSASLFENFVHGAPPFAPLLFVDLGILAAIGLGPASTCPPPGDPTVPTRTPRRRSGRRQDRPAA